MATETVVHETSKKDWEGGKQPFHVSYGKLMMWYFLLSDAFTFAGFLIAYGTLRIFSPTWPIPDYVFKSAPFGIENMPLVFVTFMSFLLIVSSVTMVRAVQEGHRYNKKGVVFWMLLTILGGLGFLSCQAWEWTNLIATEGVSIKTNPFSSHTEPGTYLSNDELAKLPALTKQMDEHGTAYFVNAEGHKYYEKADHHGESQAGQQFKEGDSYLITYHNGEYYPGAYKTPDGTVKSEPFGPRAFGALFFFITGFHGFHVFSGVVFLFIIMLNAANGLYQNRHNHYEMVEKIGLYWHFVDLVWVFVFLVFYLL
jgi:cytochrome c oxidase subunit 3